MPEDAWRDTRKTRGAQGIREDSWGVNPLRVEVRPPRRWEGGGRSKPARSGSRDENAAADTGLSGALPAAASSLSTQSPPARFFPELLSLSGSGACRGLGGWGSGRARGVASGAGVAEGGSHAEGSGPRRREGRPSPGSGAPLWDWFLRSHFLSNQTADWRREPTRAALEVCVSLRPMIAPKPTPL